MDELQKLGDDLSREITSLQQALLLKSDQLDKTRRQLRKEMIDRQTALNALDVVKTDLDNAKVQLEVNLKAKALLEEEHSKSRDVAVKLQAQMDAYLKEREMLINRCHYSDIEICKLKNQIGDLQSELQESLSYKERYEHYQAKTVQMIDHINSKQALLDQEQIRLNQTCEKGLSVAADLIKKLNVQCMFVKEANLTRVHLENETIRLIGALEHEKRERKKLMDLRSEHPNSYLNEWKESQIESNGRVQYLIDENTRLMEEIEALKAQMDLMNEGKDVCYLPGSIASEQ